MATDQVAELKKNLRSGKLVLGTERMQKELRQGTLSKVFLTTNVSDGLRVDILRYCELGNCAAEQLGISNKELGVICKKPFSVSVAGLLK